MSLTVSDYLTDSFDLFSKYVYILLMVGFDKYTLFAYLVNVYGF